MAAFSAHWSWRGPFPTLTRLAWRGNLEFCALDPSGFSRISLHLFIETLALKKGSREALAHSAGTCLWVPR